jgi:hypothetical protein
MTQNSTIPTPTEIEAEFDLTYAVCLTFLEGY